MLWLDKLGERATRSMAHATSRRSVLNRIGTVSYTHLTLPTILLV